MMYLAGMLIPLGTGVVLPVMIVWLVTRMKINATNRRNELMLALIEKNPDIDVQDYIKKLNQSEKSIKERLMQKLLWACILIAIGVFFGGWAIVKVLCGGNDPSRIETYGALGALLTLIGVVILIVFFVTKKVMAKEIEAENKNMQQ